MRHVLPDVLAPGLRIVFCGSAAGTKSAKLGLSYAGPGNKFWPTLFSAGFTPTLWGPTDFLRLPELGYGLTDLNKTEFGMDSQLTGTGDDAAALIAKIERFAPRILAFTAKRPAQIVLLRKKLDYGFQAETIGATRVFVLPSPSGRAGAFWNESHWRALADAAR